MAVESLVFATFGPTTPAPARARFAADLVASGQASYWTATLMVLIGLVGLAALMSVLRIIPRQRLTAIWDLARTHRPKRTRRLASSGAAHVQRRRAQTPHATRRRPEPWTQRVERYLARCAHVLKRFAIAVLLLISAVASHVWRASVRLWHALLRWSRFAAHRVRLAVSALGTRLRNVHIPSMSRPHVRLPRPRRPGLHIRRPALPRPQLRRRPTSARTAASPMFDPASDDVLEPPLPPLHEHYERYPRYRDAALYTLGAIAGGLVAAAIAIYLTIFLR